MCGRNLGFLINDPRLNCNQILKCFWEEMNEYGRMQDDETKSRSQRYHLLYKQKSVCNAMTKNVTPMTSSSITF